MMTPGVDTYTSAPRASPKVASGLLARTLAGSLLDKSPTGAQGLDRLAVDAFFQQEIGRGVGIGVRFRLGEGFGIRIRHGDGSRKGADREE